jgi:hypothetical protein
MGDAAAGAARPVSRQLSTGHVDGLGHAIGRRLRTNMREVRQLLVRHGASQPRVLGAVARGCAAG